MLGNNLEEKIIFKCANNVERSSIKLQGERKNICSDSCCKVYWTLHKDKQRRLVPEKFNCIICNKEYYEYPIRKRKYCSRECYYISKRKVVDFDES